MGVTPDFSPAQKPRTSPGYLLKTAYSDAVFAAGGLPLVLPYTDHGRTVDGYLDCIEALVITGSPFDIPPESYGEKRRDHCRDVHDGRTRFEQMLLEHALARDLPVLGVCNGMQLLNVVRGGTLYQDIGEEVDGATRHEQQEDRREPTHAIEVFAGTRLARAVGKGTLMVNSTHHQAVSRLGRGLVASARSPDGLVEAIELVAHRFVLGVQWHPEYLIDSVPAHRGLYRALVKAAMRG